MPASSAADSIEPTHSTSSAPPPRKGFFRRLGPGLITGASDDDPSGIATYSQAGAQFGFTMLWVALFTLPLMAAIQEISARIGRVTGRGIAGNIRKHYPGWVLYPIILLLIVSNTINIGADIGAMGASVAALIGGWSLLYCAVFALAIVIVEVFISYRKFADIMKWLTVVLFAYIITAFRAHVPWRHALYYTIVPHIDWRNADYIAMFIAVLGTTISPYLFFWQASLETEEIRNNEKQEPLKAAPRQARRQFERIRIDTYAGMTVSNVVAYFIILTAAATIHPHWTQDSIRTAQEAAEALKPAAGRAASLIFALGIIGTGLLAVPVLAGSAAYAVGEALKWPTGLDRKPLDARGFYGVLAASTLIGLAINFPAFHINPIRALVWSAIINGIVAVPVMIITMLMFSRKKIMGPFTLTGKTLRVVGWIATAVMAAAAVGLFITWKS